MIFSNSKFINHATRVRDQIARMHVCCVSFAYRSGALMSRIFFACETVVDSIVSSIRSEVSRLRDE